MKTNHSKLILLACLIASSLSLSSCGGDTPKDGNTIEKPVSPDQPDQPKKPDTPKTDEIKNDPTDGPKITLISPSNQGSWRISLTTDEHDSIWIDWNYNFKKDPGEQIEASQWNESKPTEISHPKITRAITIHGNLASVFCKGDVDQNINNLSQVKISNSNNLVAFSCGHNQITDLDISGAPDLTLLSCYENQLQQLNLSKNSSLSEIIAYGNQFKSIDVSQCKKLTKLKCYNNKLTSLDVTQNPNLFDLDCSHNKISNLDLSHSSKMKILEVGNNPITQLNLDTMPDLLQLFAYDMPITELNLSKNTSLMTLYCQRCKLTSLNLKTNTLVDDIRIYNNSLDQENMQSFIKSLPTTSDGTLVIIDSKSKLHDNAHSPEIIKLAEDKHWKVLDNNGNSYDQGKDPIQ